MKRLFIAFAAISCIAASAHAGTEVFLNISKKFGQKIRVAVPSFAVSAGAKTEALKSSDQLQNDLLLSGYFTPVKERQFVEETQRDDQKTGRINLGEWKRIGADMVIKGAYSERGGRIEIRCEIYATIDGKKVFDRTYDDAAAKRRALIHRITDDIVKALTGERGIAQTKIAFVMGSGKSREICIADYDGFNAKKLTHDGALALYPKWSPDNRKIVYTGYINGRPEVFL
ncbi:MAG TPA: hypothetical protein P5287_06820, partial [bacterium]|nr:hypothetical protein [bacterium]